MSYNTIATISQVTSLLMFIAMFAGVLAYALWPKNGARFEEAQRRALDIPIGAASERQQARP